jgi:diacylglycerol O-acyltransferase
MLPYLPVDIADPVERLRAVQQRIRERQAAQEPLAGESLTALAAYGPFAPVSEGIRLALRLPQRQVATVTTNVPGPRATLYALGRELQELLPYVPIADRVRIGVAIHSYRDLLTFGLTGDYDGAPDLEVLAGAIRASLDELVGHAPAEVVGS